MVAYITNPITGRQIQYGGNTFNRLIAQGYQVIDWRLVQRQTDNDGNPINQTRLQYHNIETGRMVTENSRTYHFLLSHGYHTLRDSFNEDNYYIIPDNLRLEAELAVIEIDPDMSLRNLYRIQQSGVIQRMAEREARRRRRRRRLTQEEVEREAELAGLDNIDWTTLITDDNRPITQSDRDRMMGRLNELNIMLCKECQMPYNPNDLVDGLCKEC
jgi:hypothetical protein